MEFFFEAEGYLEVHDLDLGKILANGSVLTAPVLQG